MNIDTAAMEREWAERIAAAGVATEAELRAATVPTAETPEALSAYIASLVDRPHDYGTCVYAMSMAAVAAFNYVAHHLGVTGFQAGCADLDIIRRTRRIDGPFIILQAEDMLYPQYDVHRKLREFIADVQPWCREQATQKLAEPANAHAHPNVRAHWERLAQTPTTDEQ